MKREDFFSRALVPLAVLAGIILYICFFAVEITQDKVKIGGDFYPVYLGSQLANEDAPRLYRTDFQLYVLPRAQNQIFWGEFPRIWKEKNPESADMALADLPMILSFIHPPHAFLYFWPFGQLADWRVAFALYVGLGLFFALLAFGLAAPRGERGLRMLFLLLFPGTYLAIGYGQTGLWTAALLVGFLGLLHRMPFLSGVLVAILSFKPQIGFLAPFTLLFGRHWRALVACILFGLFLFALSCAVFGTSLWEIFVRALFTQSNLSAEDFTEGTALWLMLSPYIGTKLLNLPAGVAPLIQASLSLIVITLVGRVWHSDADRRLKESVLLLAIPLFTPYFYHYDSLLIAWALCNALSSIMRRCFDMWAMLEMALIFMLWMSPVVVSAFSFERLPLAPLYLLVLFGLQVRLFYVGAKTSANRDGNSPYPLHSEAVVEITNGGR